MNRIVICGVALFLAVVGLSLLGTDKEAVAGGGVYGCSGGHVVSYGCSGCHGAVIVDSCHGCHGCYGGHRRLFARHHRYAPACHGCHGCSGCYGGVVQKGGMVVQKGGMVVQKGGVVQKGCYGCSCMGDPCSCHGHQRLGLFARLRAKHSCHGCYGGCHGCHGAVVSPCACCGTVVQKGGVVVQKGSPVMQKGVIQK